MPTEPETGVAPFALTGVRDVATSGAQGDAIPFFHAGRYHVFYLCTPVGQTDRAARLRTDWSHVVSDDLVHWRELPVAVPPGAPGEPDSDGVWTGSVIQVGETTHLYYTAHQEGGSGAQVVCHATSTDLVEFTKDPANPILVPVAPFATTDWRDPFVFWNDAEQRYRMLISTRTLTGPPGRRGAIALATSPDLSTWDIRPEPFYSPGTTHVPECPEVFRLGDRWRLVFSRYSEDPATVYRDADSLDGPWRTPERDAWDGARWYAAKSLADGGGRRIAFGWAHDRLGQVNDGEWLWGGDFCWPREIRTDDSGALSLRMPDEVSAAVTPTEPARLVPTFGTWSGGAASSVAGLATADVELPEIPAGSAWVLDVEVEFDEVRDSFGISIDSGTLEDGFGLIVEPGRGVASLQEWRAAGEGGLRPPPLVRRSISRSASGRSDIRLVLRQSVAEFFIDDAVVLTHRRYPARERTVTAFVQDGQAAFSVRSRILS